MSTTATSTEQLLEALERTLSEMEALQAIYDESFSLCDTGAWEQAQQAVAQGRFLPDDTKDENCSTRVIRLNARLDLKPSVQLSLGFPPGYPEYCAVRVSILTWTDHTRADCERLTRQLHDRAQSLIGHEAVMDLVQELQEIISMEEETVECDKAVSSKNGSAKQNDAASDHVSKLVCQDSTTNANDCDGVLAAAESLGRRWIWVHHITDTARRKSILQEAREHQLGGYLKFGYPGVIVVEGRTTDCNEFVSWVKGSKSRPGGFGRNWGHHVRGEINQEKSKRCFSLEFSELEDMRDLGAACKEAGVEDEFLAYVMQHN